MSSWKTVLQLDSKRQVTGGDETSLANAIRAGADLRIGTAFLHNEHVDLSSDSNEIVEEATDFRITYLLEDRWVAGVENLRVPIEIPNGFGPRESMSFFLYNQDAHQAVARPFLDGHSVSESSVESWEEAPLMPKYHELDNFDAATNAPSINFIYDFEYYNFMVRSNWTEVLAHDAEGKVISGDVSELARAVKAGAEVKIAVRGLCDDLSDNATELIDHEVFIHLGACFYYTQQQLLIGSANPVVRASPSLPLVYATQAWDVGWLMPRTDGHVARWLVDPYTLKFRRDFACYAMRWFISD